VHISNSLFLRIFQVINQAIFEASKTPDKNTFVKIMEASRLRSLRKGGSTALDAPRILADDQGRRPVHDQPRREQHSVVVGGSEYLGLCDSPGVAHDSSSLDRFDDVLASYFFGPHVFWSCII